MSYSPRSRLLSVTLKEAWDQGCVLSVHNRELGTLFKHDGNAKENVTQKVKLLRDYSNSFSLSNLAELSWSLIRWDSVQVQIDFTFGRFVERMVSPLEQVCDVVESAEESRKLVDWKSEQV